MKRLIPLLLIVLSSVSGSVSYGYERGQFRLAGLLGQVGLFGDPGSGGANGLGLGGSAAFQISEPLALELRYLGSSNSNVTHRDLSVGAEYAWADYESAYPHVEAGMSFIHNDFKTGSVGADAAGLYVGVGLDFELAKSLQIGPEARFVKAFEARGPVAGQTITTVGDGYSVLIRLSYLFSRD